jgi:drug/metabolite transporter (DMT)-like permease
VEDSPSRRRTALVGIGLVNLATIVWTTNMILGRWLRNDIGPLTLAASRFFIASVLRRSGAWVRTAGFCWEWPSAA